MKQKEHHVIISLASNENQEANLEAARVQLTQLLTSVRFTSAIWTEPVNVQCSMFNVQSRKYLNQLCEGTTTFGEGLLCEVLKEAEKRQGRTHNEDGIVTLDLDLLEYDGVRHHLRDWERSYVKDLISEL
ncbi:MAG: 2-amino-4-hydroxy-6-hydroxymethyldihydropteridine diphosphokinase [Prevotella sp.]|jgi:2-amino-4-hydroxy-6-hydroxymethyldihydropteridine diphosphokinase|nr:2-amino-4-hydroxy-6-hydroxymethyldihydropteridine diphosphokinase [Prevotella sp.]MEE3445022.1 2-amino-4-hydroxy-6-hydroxymethyldihydropteridine diphosphokinase [Prevotella sp.]